MDTRGLVLLIAADNYKFLGIRRGRGLVELYDQNRVALKITVHSREHDATTDLGIAVDAYDGLAAGFGGPRFLFSDLGNFLGSRSIPSPLTHKSCKSEEEW
jgi:hypothetical protein